MSEAKRPFKFVNSMDIDGKKFIEITDQAFPNIHPEKFYISYDGTIYNATTHRFSAGTITPRGYVAIELTDKNNNRFSTMQHVAIERVFDWFPGCLDLEVNHINGIRNDNRFSNLELVTHLENMHHAYATGLNKTYGENHPYATTTEAQVRQICEYISNGDTRSYAEIGAEIGVSEMVVTQVAMGITWRRVSKEYNLPYDRRNSRFTDDQVHEMCTIFVENSGKSFDYIVHKVADELGYEYNHNFRNKLKRI